MASATLIQVNSSQNSVAAPDCAACPIRGHAICAACATEDLPDLEDARFYRSYQAGQVVIWAGEPMEFVASVVSGVASVSRTLEDGRTQTVGLLLPSDFLGRPGRVRAQHTITALSDLRLCCFRRRNFESLLGHHPELLRRLLEITMDELDAARDWLVVVGRKTAREKIASFLVQLALRQQSRTCKAKDITGEVELLLPMTREAMAEYLGLTLETVSRQFSALRRDGLVQSNGRRQLVLTNFARLVSESGDDADGGYPS